MIIKSARLRNFRSALDVLLPCDALTALVGSNGAGKSCFLRALQLFYEPSPRFTVEDCYANDAFGELDAEERERFAPYLDNETLTVTRVLSLASGRPSAKYYGTRLQNPDFQAVRVTTGAREAVTKYNELREAGVYSELPPVRSRDAALEQIRAWETAHPERCVQERDEGQFFGFTGVGQGYLGRHTRLILIPAVRDAAEDAADGKGSPIGEIMDMVVRNALASRKDLAELKTDVEARYGRIVTPDMPELNVLASQLSTTLKTYVPFADVSLQWTRGLDIDLPLPKADVRLSEDGFSCAVARTGHGLQRAFILTMLQHLAVVRDSESEGERETSPEASDAARRLETPDLVLAIEEPELFQHPSRQRHFAKVLFRLAEGSISGVASRTQVLYATHSPLFVGVDRIDQLRLIRKVDGESGKPRVTTVIRTSVDQITRAIWLLNGSPEPRFTADGMRARLQALMSPLVNEGFFAAVVVLVEGEDDRAAILGTAASMGFDLESEGVAVIPCGGKDSLDRPAVIFQQLQIPTFVVWDGDHGRSGAERNRYLLRLVGQPEEDWPASVGQRFACFKDKLETTLREEVGEDVFDPLLSQVKSELGIKKDDALKKPEVFRRLIEGARERGRRSPTLERIVEAIRRLR